MNKIIAPLLFIWSALLLCCSPVKKEHQEPKTVTSDTTEVLRSFIYGLWSMDSGNALQNVGFNFRSDDSVDFVSSHASGIWELKGTDTLKITYNTRKNSHEYLFHIDSINESRMILSDSNGIHTYRKVPFGINNEGTVIQGFTGYIDPGKSKEYLVDLPPVKKILLKMACPDSSVTFRLYDDQQKEITSAAVRNWTGIVIRSGKYKLVLFKPKESKWNEEADFDLKVVVY